MRCFVLLLCLGMLAACGSKPSVDDDAAAKIAQLQIRSLQKSLDMYYMTSGRYPKELKELTEPSRRNSQNLKPKALIDPWKRPFHYSVENNKFTLCSDGPDGKRGTKDDICL